MVTTPRCRTRSPGERLEHVALVVDQEQDWLIHLGLPSDPAVYRPGNTRTVQHAWLILDGSGGAVDGGPVERCLDFSHRTVRRGDRL